MLERGSIRQIFSEEKICRRIRELARDVYGYYERGKEDFWILYPEKGARVFAESLQQEFLKLGARQGRYQGIISIVASRTKGTGFLDEVRVENFQPQNIRGKNILLVEDIIDQGITLDAILEQLKDIVTSYQICVLVDKTEARRKPIKLDYVGFQVDEGWVVGLGMDVSEQGRDLPFIGVIDRDYS